MPVISIISFYLGFFWSKFGHSTNYVYSISSFNRAIPLLCPKYAQFATTDTLMNHIDFPTSKTYTYGNKGATIISK